MVFLSPILKNSSYNDYQKQINFTIKGCSPQHLIGLKPNTIVFYFGSKKRIITNKIQKFEKAYGNLPNSGCTKTNSKGEANFIWIVLKCIRV